MNQEIDLRSPEFIASRRLVRPVFLKYMVIVLLSFLMPGSYYGILFYSSNLQLELAAENNYLLELEERVLPLQELLEETALLKIRSGLEKELELASKPIHEYLLAVKEKAYRHQIEADSITVDNTGNLSFKGRSGNITAIASYNQDLENLPFISRPEVISVNLIHDGGYNFEIISSVGGKDEVNSE